MKLHMAVGKGEVRTLIVSIGRQLEPSVRRTPVQLTVRREPIGWIRLRNVELPVVDALLMLVDEHKDVGRSRDENLSILLSLRQMVAQHDSSPVGVIVYLAAQPGIHRVTARAPH